MKESTSKEKILKGVRNALISKNTNPFQNQDESIPVYEYDGDSLDVTFAEAFSELGGKFVYCDDFEECKQALKLISDQNQWEGVFTMDQGVANLLSDSGIKVEQSEEEFLNLKIGAGICELLVARTGSVVVSSRLPSGRKLNVFPETHLVFARTNQLFPDIKEGMNFLNRKYKDGLPSSINFITGASRTADIEKTLVMGAHGPKDIYVFLIDQ